MALTYSTIVVTQEGKIKVFGNNEYGQLGTGNKNAQYSPVQVDVETTTIGVKQVALGFYHSMVLMKDGTVKGNGFNARGQLGLGHVVDQVNFKDLALSGVKQIACGDYHTMFLMNDGTVKAVGDNSFGQLGIGNTTNQSTIQTLAISGVKEISCGCSFTMFLMNDGTVQSVGKNSVGQLGLVSTTGAMRPELLSLSGVKQITCGDGFSIFLMQDGTVKAVGQNNAGQLGIGKTSTFELNIQTTSITGVKRISSGQEHTMFLMEDGTVKAAGSNNLGQLGTGDRDQRLVATTIPITDVETIATGSYNSFFIMKDTSIKGAGYNQQGQLGIGSGQTPIAFIAQTYLYSGALTMQEYIKVTLTRFLFQQVDQLKTWLSGSWKDLSGPATKDLFLAEGVSSLTGIPISNLTNGTKILKWSDENSVSKLVTTAPKSLYDATNKLYKGIGVVETQVENVLVKPKTLIVNADHTEATLEYSLDNGLSWYTITSGEVKNISGVAGNQLKVRANLPTATATLTALSYAWA